MAEKELRISFKEVDEIRKGMKIPDWPCSSERRFSDCLIYWMSDKQFGVVKRDQMKDQDVECGSTTQIKYGRAYHFAVFLFGGDDPDVLWEAAAAFDKKRRDAIKKDEESILENGGRGCRSTKGKTPLSDDFVMENTGVQHPEEPTVSAPPKKKVVAARKERSATPVTDNAPKTNAATGKKKVAAKKVKAVATASNEPDDESKTAAAKAKEAKQKKKEVEKAMTATRQDAAKKLFTVFEQPGTSYETDLSRPTPSTANFSDLLNSDFLDSDESSAQPTVPLYTAPTQSTASSLSLIRESIAESYGCNDCPIKDEELKALREQFHQLSLDYTHLQSIHQRQGKELEDLKKQFFERPANVQVPSQNHYTPARGMIIDKAEYLVLTNGQEVPEGFERIDISNVVVKGTWLSNVLNKCKKKTPSFILKMIITGLFEPWELNNMCYTKLRDMNTTAPVLKALELFALNQLKMTQAAFSEAVTSKCKTMGRRARQLQF